MLTKNKLVDPQDCAGAEVHHQGSMHLGQLVRPERSLCSWTPESPPLHLSQDQHLHLSDEAELITNDPDSLFLSRRGQEL